MAKRWQGKVQFLFLYKNEAHPLGRGSENVPGFMEKVQHFDKDGDGLISRNEWQAPMLYFDGCDWNEDGFVNSPELAAMYRMGDFKEFAEPNTIEERLEAARLLRREIPGTVPIVVDTMDNRTAEQYSKLPNPAFVIGQDQRITHSLSWAEIGAIEQALREVIGEDNAPPREAETPPNWQTIAAQTAAARAAKLPLLLSISAPGCGACETMSNTTLKEPQVQAELTRYHLEKLSVENDEYWDFFEALKLSITPAFVIVDGLGQVRRKTSGLQSPAEFIGFLREP